jgi:hypothetical protein
MKDHPHKNAEHLIADYGMDGAIKKTAVEGMAKANDVEEL